MSEFGGGIRLRHLPAVPLGGGPSWTFDSSWTNLGNNEHQHRSSQPPHSLLIRRCIYYHGIRRTLSASPYPTTFGINLPYVLRSTIITWPTCWIQASPSVPPNDRVHACMICMHDNISQEVGVMHDRLGTIRASTAQNNSQAKATDCSPMSFGRNVLTRASGAAWYSGDD
jgi:hypothetical protein